MTKGVKKYISVATTEDGDNKMPVSKSVGAFSDKSETPLTLSDKMAEEEKVDRDAVGLKRRVGLFSGVALIVGTMIGSGIFISPKGVLLRTGSVGLSLVSWTICGCLAMLGALCYAELGTVVPKSGAEYAYLLEAFSPMNKVVGAIPAFLFSWTTVIVLKPSALAVISLSFAEYMAKPFFETCDPPDSIRKVAAAVCICLIAFVNCFSVHLATRIQNFFTSAKLLAVVIISIGGVVKLCQGNLQYLSTGFEGSTSSFSDVATALYSGLWAYDGWNNLNYVTEEIKNPNKNLPRAIWIGIPLVTTCYLLVNISYLTVMSPDDILSSEAVAVTFGERVLGVMAWIIPVFVACSTFGAANGSCFTSGRLCFVTAREGHLVKVLSFVHIKKHTPCPAVLFNAGVALIMVSLGNIASLIDFFSFTAWIFYGSTIVCLFVFRITKKNVPRPYKVPLIFPILVFFISLYLIVAPIVQNPQVEYLYAATFIFAGLFFYFPFVYFKFQLKCMEYVTIFIQLLLQVAPTND